MKRIVVLEVISVQLLLLGGIAFPAYAEHFLGIRIQTPNVVVQQEPVVVQPPPMVVVQPQPVYVQPPQVVIAPPQPVYVQPQPVVVQPQPVYVQPQPVVVQPQPVYVQPQPVVVEPYTVMEGGVSILVDPEDYYYADRGVYYHHNYMSDRDVVVTTVPSQYHFLHSRLDINTVPQKHFHHHERNHPVLRALGLEKRDKRD